MPGVFFLRVAVGISWRSAGGTGQGHWTMSADNSLKEFHNCRTRSNSIKEWLHSCKTLSISLKGWLYSCKILIPSKNDFITAGLRQSVTTHCGHCPCFWCMHSIFAAAIISIKHAHVSKPSYTVFHFKDNFYFFFLCPNVFSDPKTTAHQMLLHITQSMLVMHIWD